MYSEEDNSLVLEKNLKTPRFQAARAHALSLAVIITESKLTLKYSYSTKAAAVTQLESSFTRTSK